MRTLKLTVAYDGTGYAGWQFQPDQPTVQGAIEAALAEITGQPTRVVGSGRTDAGVHALGQAVSFSTECAFGAEVFLRALNAKLPKDIVVRTAEDMPPGFHAIRDARRKRYRYVIDNGPLHDPFARAYRWHCRRPLDAARMHDEAQSLLGTHDFSSFETQGSARPNSIRTVLDVAVARGTGDQQHQIGVEVEADGFLYNMVRTIVGSLKLVGQGTKPVGWLAGVLSACDRRVAGPTAPPQGLFLLHVTYDRVPAVLGSPGANRDCD